MPKKKKGGAAAASSAADDDYDPDALLKVGSASCITARQECSFLLQDAATE
jgi:hypothetical protein